MHSRVPDCVPGTIRVEICSEQEARVMALRLCPPPEGYGNWSLRLLARPVVGLGRVALISNETVRKTLGKQHHGAQATVLGNPS